MPHAVTHVLLALIVADIIRDYLTEDKREVPLYLVLIAGIAGLLPDIDIIVYWFMKIVTSVEISEIHRTFSHTLFVPAAFLIIGLATYKMKRITKYKISISHVAFFIVLGVIIHLFLDFAISGWIRPFYPINSYPIGLNIVPMGISRTVIPGMDAILLVVWLVHEYRNHRIKDFI